MHVDERLKAIPDLDRSKMPGVDQEVADKLFVELLKGGQESITDLIGRLDAADNGSDYRVRFSLHNLAKVVATPERKSEREMFVKTLLAGLDGSHPAAVAVFLVQQLQWIAGEAEVGTLLPLLEHEDLRLFDATLATLVVIGKAATAPLQAAMDKADPHRSAAIKTALLQM